MAEAVYWIWLQQALGIGSHKADALLEKFSSPEEIYQLTAGELSATGLLAPGEAERVKATPLENAQKQLEKAQKFGCAVLTPEDPRYPRGLKHIDGIPCVLYVLGNPSLENDLAITIVGTRTASVYGLNAAWMLSRDLAAAGCVIVSGLANGIDQAAHEGALAGGGRSVGLMACGLDINYPAGARELKQRILACDGALISEYPIGTPVEKYHFAVRNRVLSGISAGVLVVEAPIHSGALITARHAANQGRDVFAVPGRIFDEAAAGCLELIEDGVKLCKNPYSVLEEYNGRFPGNIRPDRIRQSIEAVGGISPPDWSAGGAPRPAPNKAQAHAAKIIQFPVSGPEKRTPGVASPTPDLERKRPFAPEELKELGVSPEAAQLYEAMGETPVDCGQLSQSTGRSVKQLMAALTELELRDLVLSQPGGLYLRAKARLTAAPGESSRKE